VAEFVEIGQINPSGAIIVQLRQHIPADPRRSRNINQSDSPFPHQPGKVTPNHRSFRGSIAANLADAL